jgi:hypothetical protein
MSEQNLWRLVEVGGLLTAFGLLVPWTALPRVLGRLLVGLGEDPAVRKQARLAGVATAWVLLLACLVRIAYGGAGGSRTWLAGAAALGWVAGVVAADHGYLSFLAVLGRLAAWAGRLLYPPTTPPASADLPADRAA